jgi:hypothetical protein
MAKFHVSIHAWEVWRPAYKDFLRPASKAYRSFSAAAQPHTLTATPARPKGNDMNALAEGSGQTKGPAVAGTAERHDAAPEGPAPEGYVVSGGIEGVGSVVAFLASDAARWVTGDVV